MSKKEFHSGKIVCDCGNRGSVEYWEWENPEHHGGDYKAKDVEHQGKFKRISELKFICDICGLEPKVF